MVLILDGSSELMRTSWGYIGNLMYFRQLLTSKAFTNFFNIFPHKYAMCSDLPSNIGSMVCRDNEEKMKRRLGGRVPPTPTSRRSRDRLETFR